MNRLHVRLGLPLTLAALALTGCAGTSASSSTTPSSAAPSAAGSAAASAAASAAPAAAEQTIHITYANGKVAGVPSRVKVKLNSTVALVVTSDTADEVHFHGYDLHADVTKGGTVTITFEAKIPGVFEVELENLKHRLVLLQVQ
jgi:plastocyanin